MDGQDSPEISQVTCGILDRHSLEGHHRLSPEAEKILKEKRRKERAKKKHPPIITRKVTGAARREIVKKDPASKSVRRAKKRAEMGKKRRPFGLGDEIKAIVKARS